ncbi:MAG: hypothetical protein ACXWAT_00460 [Methylobacter sp.]
MSLQTFLLTMSKEHLAILQSDIAEAGIAMENGGDYKAIFERRRKECSGKRKKIYAALKKASKKDIDVCMGIFAESV